MILLIKIGPQRGPNIFGKTESTVALATSMQPRDRLLSRTLYMSAYLYIESNWGNNALVRFNSMKVNSRIIDIELKVNRFLLPS